ncbi:HSF-type DNA-binding-domain-containing protein, partial [Ochromonadaceae sp. CCMP2298]
MEIEDGDIVHWAPHGFAFVVTNQERFLKDIVPKYFKHTKLTSFQRQLNLYGFRRLTKGEDQGAYFHPKFQRSRREMMAEIKR